MRIARLLLIVSVGFVVLTVLSGAWLYHVLEQPYQGYAETEQIIEIPPGANADLIANRLIGAGVIRDRWTFQWVLWRSGGARRLQAGDYRFTGPMTAREVVDKLVRGEVILEPITFPEGLTIPEMGQVFATRGFGSAASFEAAARRRELITDLDPEAPDLEGYLFPDTYAVPRRTTADQLVRAMVERFRQAFDADLRAAALARGLTVRQAVALGSLVEEETARAGERPLVAAVYANRLKLGMGLQCDPTVIYALQRAGRYTGNLRREDLSFDSPYNTYLYAGLPPGPIAAPGRASLESAVRPADVDYLYFVSRNDGSHVFARSLREHNRNVQEFQIRYFQERRLRGRAPSP